MSIDSSVRDYGSIVTEYNTAVDSLDAEDKLAFGRLWLELISCIFGDGNQEDIPEIVKTMKEIISSKEESARAFKFFAKTSQPSDKLFVAWKKEIANQIKSLRTEKKITQQKLAELTGIEKNYIARLESGEISPSFKTRELIANALGENESYFVYNEEELLKRIGQ